MMHETTTRARMTDDGERSDDTALLRRYAESRSEEAFAELVRRRIGLVYSVALRHTGDAQRAEDVTQAVFVALARKAGELARRPVLVGWLYRSAQFAASDAVRVEVRRKAREQEVYIMNEIERESPTPDWERLRAVLDEVLGDLEERDRDAVLLRYFDGEPFAEVGAKLRLSENAARMRVERALEKLHGALARRGVKSTAAALGLALAGQAGVAAPAGLAASATVAALAGVGAGMSGLTMKLLWLGLAVAASVGVGLWISEGRAQVKLREEIARLQRDGADAARLVAENKALSGSIAEVAALRRDDEELTRLRDEVAELKERLKRKVAADRATAPKASISGMIRMPGMYLFPQSGTMTLTDFLAKAGGITALADPKKIRVSRRQANGSIKIFVKDAEGEGGFGVESGDTVYVPEKIL